MLPLTEDCCVKDNIVSLLCNQHDLSAREIWYRINKFRNVTYHGVYKAVCELRGTGVLDKSIENKYSLSSRWLNNLHNFISSFHGQRGFDRKNRDGQILP